VAGNNTILARKKTKVKIASLGRLFLSISLFLPSQRKEEQALIFFPHTCLLLKRFPLNREPKKKKKKRGKADVRKTNNQY
jgi:hypothetical protein